MDGDLEDLTADAATAPAAAGTNTVDGGDLVVLTPAGKEAKIKFDRKHNTS